MNKTARWLMNNSCFVCVCQHVCTFSDALPWCERHEKRLTKRELCVAASMSNIHIDTACIRYLINDELLWVVVCGFPNSFALDISHNVDAINLLSVESINLLISFSSLAVTEAEIMMECEQHETGYMEKEKEMNLSMSIDCDYTVYTLLKKQLDDFYNLIMLNIDFSCFALESILNKSITTIHHLERIVIKCNIKMMW